MEDQLVDTWRIHNRINLFMLDAIDPEHLDDSTVTKGRSVGSQLAHMHNVRLMWLQASGHGSDGLQKIENDAVHDKSQLQSALEQSADAIAMLIASAIASGGKVKGFKPHVTAFVAYMIAHESHHRGQIAMRLKQAGHPLDKKTSYGMWEWGVR